MALLTYNISTYTGVIDGFNITIDLPFLTIDITKLIATFTVDINVVSVKIGTIEQISGVTENDFTLPLTYILTYDDDSIENYIVTLQNTENKLLTFDVPSLQAISIINDETNVVILNVNQGSVLTSLNAVYTLSTNATSDIPTNPIDLSNPLVIKVTSQSGIENTYFLKVLQVPNHNTPELTILKMVLNKLPFIENTEKNIDLLSELTFENMIEIESCFNIGTLPDGTYDISRVGQERLYSMYQKSIIADILCMNLLMNWALKTIGGDKQSSTQTEATIKYIKSVQAGSVNVGYDQISLKDKGILAVDTLTAIQNFKNSIDRKMTKIGCSFFNELTNTPTPYIGFFTSGAAVSII